MEGKTLDQVALDVLKAGVGISEQPVKRRDLSEIAGTWVEDPIFEEIRKEHEQIDSKIWK